MKGMADGPLELIRQRFQFPPVRAYEQARFDEARAKLHIVIMVILP
jgi:hypothetical protein